MHPNLAARNDVVLLLPRRPDEATWRPSDVLEFVQEHGSETALVFLSGVHYATGQLFDMAAITRTAHERYEKERATIWLAFFSYHVPRSHMHT